jgi:hypothetical protein
MDLERLTAQEVVRMGKVLELVGMPAAPDELESRINTLEGAATVLRKELKQSRAASAAHGE